MASTPLPCPTPTRKNLKDALRRRIEEALDYCLSAEDLDEKRAEYRNFQAALNALLELIPEEGV